jgi:hypothetical protein
MRNIGVIKLSVRIMCLFLVSACQSGNRGTSTSNKVGVSDDVKIVWVGGLRGLNPNLGLAGSCPQPEIYPDEIPNESGVGFGICFVPMIGGHATQGIRYEITLPGEGVINPITKERVTKVGGLTNCFNGQPCFGGYIPSQYEFIPGEWLFQFYKIDRKIIEYRFVVKESSKKIDKN